MAWLCGWPCSSSRGSPRPARRTFSVTPSRAIRRVSKPSSMAAILDPAPRPRQAIIRQGILSETEAMQPHLERADLELLLAIREHGSLAGAASTADVVPSVITKRLAALETRLGLKLFQRTTRRVVPTAEGEALCERALGLLAGFSAMEAELQERQKEPVGRIRL